MSITLLVADDSITIQKVIGIIFGGDEYSLTVVDNGKTAVDVAREINPDILLIDALMPGMSGYEVAELVRATPSLAAKPILLMTGSFEPFDEEKAKKCGADDVIAKPFESQQIIAKVKELLALAGSRSVALPDQPLQPLPEPIPEFSAPAFETPAPLYEQPPAPPQPAAPADIWGAFTPETEQPHAEPVTPAVVEPEPASLEPDVFALVTEEHDAHLVQTVVSAGDAQSQQTGSQWIPVEENTFDFQEPATEFLHAADAAEQTIPVSEENAFGDFVFEEVEEPTVVPDYSTVSGSFDTATPAPDFASDTAESLKFETPTTPPLPFTPLADPTPVINAVAPTTPTIRTDPTVLTDPVATFTEEQLRAALAGVSKEIIEKIVWEVVPDLAEVLIREAIRKIKEGV